MSSSSKHLNALAETDHIFFNPANTPLSLNEAEQIVSQALTNMEDGELFLEYSESEVIALDEGIIRSASFNSSKGFGLRAVTGDESGYAHSDEISKAALERAANTLTPIQKRDSSFSASPTKTNHALYRPDNPLKEQDFSERAATLSEIDLYARAANPHVVQVSASLTSHWQAVQIIRPDGQRTADIRPLVRLNVSIVIEKNGRREDGSFGCGGRYPLSRLLNKKTWKHAVNEALRQAKVNMESIAAPAGEMAVVLGAGWPGILLHEAVGHGLEGDFNRKKTSAFAEMVGKRVAAPGVTIVDDGTLPDCRGSLNIDDEGTPTNRTVMIEDGILTGFIQDRLNARLMNTHSTGNGRRQSYAYPPMPRMTNTIMLAGNATTEEMISSTKKGLYAVNFGGGQVDITSGKFVFAASEAYMIENGKITRPVKGATLIGDGPSVLTKVSMIGNNMALDPGIGTCGKAGQGVPVGVGQPTLKITGITVGGTSQS
ncbi:metalloprotease TldD [Entomobacter blattae]|uniref:Metalloprotease TldD n=1 Tax=Entomobacter blattae TaxID=2762277 RepID=A0A7H1NNZ0_9PROT|nr:metalloprotease TldD [Entomobacter blattae]QNT77500.1 Metalloprotease TldD [Entomobacter blattae]